jgi:hypothetical protein
VQLHPELVLSPDAGASQRKFVGLQTFVPSQSSTPAHVLGQVPSLLHLKGVQSACVQVAIISLHV